MERVSAGQRCHPLLVTCKTSADTLRNERNERTPKANQVQNGCNAIVGGWVVVVGAWRWVCVCVWGGGGGYAAGFVLVGRCAEHTSKLQDTSDSGIFSLRKFHPRIAPPPNSGRPFPLIKAVLLHSAYTHTHTHAVLSLQ
jgi:hypothetical protein